MWYEQYIMRVFDVFDDNGDGHIDSSELGMILFPEQYGEDGGVDSKETEALNPTDEESGYDKTGDEAPLFEEYIQEWGWED